ALEDDRAVAAHDHTAGLGFVPPGARVRDGEPVLLALDGRPVAALDPPVCAAQDRENAHPLCGLRGRCAWVGQLIGPACPGAARQAGPLGDGATNLSATGSIALVGGHHRRNAGTWRY